MVNKFWVAKEDLLNNKYKFCLEVLRKNLKCENKIKVFIIEDSLSFIHISSQLLLNETLEL